MTDKHLPDLYHDSIRPDDPRNQMRLRMHRRGIERLDSLVVWLYPWTEVSHAYLDDSVQPYLCMVHEKDQLVALDYLTGHVRWRSSLTGQSLPSNRDIIVVIANDVLTGLDRWTGDKRWRVEVDREDESSLTTSVIMHNPLPFAEVLVASARNPFLSGPSVFAVIDVVSGATLWRQPAWPEISNLGVGNGLVYAMDDQNGLYVFEALSGARSWRFWSGTSDPISLLKQDTRHVYTIHQGVVYALEALSGSVVWYQEDIGSALRSWYGILDNGVLDMDLDGQILFISTDSDNLIALDRSSGSCLWRQEIGRHMGLTRSKGFLWWEQLQEEPKWWHYSTDSAVIVFAKNRPASTSVEQALALRRDTGEPDSKLTDLVSSIGPVADLANWNDVLLCVGEDKRLRTIDTANAQIRWQATWLVSDNRQVSFLHVQDGVVYVVGHDGFLYACDAVTGAEHWSFDAGTIQTIQVDKRLVLISTDAELIALRHRSGVSGSRLA